MKLVLTRCIATLIFTLISVFSVEAKPYQNVGPAAEKNVTSQENLLVAQAKMDPDIKFDFEVDPKRALQTAGQVQLRTDKAFYEFGETISATVFFAESDPEDKGLAVFAVSRTGDVELIVLRKTGKGQYETAGSRAKLDIDSGKPTPHDGILEALPGEAVQALLYINQKTMKVESNIISDVAIIGSNAEKLPKLTVTKDAMNEDELAVQNSDRPFGVYVVKGGPFVEVALGEVIFRPYGLWDLNSFLSYSGGKIVDEAYNGKVVTKDNSDINYLIQVPLSRARDDKLADLRDLYGEQAEAIVGQEATFKTIALALEYRMKGYAVSVNPRLRPHGRFSTTEITSGNRPASMAPLDRVGAPCSPTDLTCPVNVERLWAHMALWDLDTPASEVGVAFIDQGFATASPDFRRPASGTPLIECDLEARPPACGPGRANSTPTVGASLVGQPVWHGTGSVSVAGGVLNNGWIPGLPGTGINSAIGGSAGVGGQVVVPMLYRMGLRTFLFDVGTAIGFAVRDGASCINIAAGFPCRAPSALGSLDLCTPSAGCALIMGSTQFAAVTAIGHSCGASAVLGGLIDAFLPGLGSTIAVATCSAAVAAGTTTVAAATTACVAIVVLGNTRDPLQAGVAAATAAGVPIIASIGNVIFPPEIVAPLRDFLDLGSIDADAFEVVPATIDPVIAVGAAMPSPWRNNHMRGRSVTVWAPENNSYLAPAIGAALPTNASGFTVPASQGGSSGPSSYVTGLVATMQAADPTLNPRTPTLTAAQRAGIPGRIAAILRSTATELGTSSEEPSRLTMVNPYSALLSAWGAWPRNYDRMLNFDDDGTDDSVAGARNVNPGESVTGTIISSPGTGGAPSNRDTDMFSVTARPSGAFSDATTVRVELSFPVRSLVSTTDDLTIFTPTDRANPVWTMLPATVVGGGTGVAPFTKTVPFETVAPAGFPLPFAVVGIGGNDNVYRITVSEVRMRGRDRFDLDNSRNLNASRPNNNERSRAVPIASNDASALSWAPDSSFGAISTTSALNLPDLTFHDDDDVDWFVFPQLPSGPGRASPPGCRSALQIAWDPNVSVEMFVGNEGQLLDSPDRNVIRVENPQHGLSLRLTPRMNRASNRYQLNLRFFPAPRGGPC